MSRSTGNSQDGGCGGRDVGNQPFSTFDSSLTVLGEDPQLTLAQSASAKMTLGCDSSGNGTVDPSGPNLVLQATTVKIGSTNLTSGGVGTATGVLSLSANGSSPVSVTNPLVVTSTITPQASIRYSSAHLVDTAINSAGVVTVTPSSGALTLAGNLTASTLIVGNTNVMSGEVGTLSGSLSLSCDGVNAVRVLNHLEVTSTATTQQSIRYDDTHKLDTSVSSSGVITLTPSSGALTLAGALTASSLSTSTISAPTGSNLSLSTVDSTGKLITDRDVYLNESKSLFLRDNQSHSLFYSGAVRTFAGLAVEGPVLEGNEAGVLAISAGGDKAVAVWNTSGVTVNTGTKPTFGVPLEVGGGLVRISGGVGIQSDIAVSGTGQLMFTPSSTPAEVLLANLTLRSNEVTTSSGDLVLSAAGGDVTANGTFHATTALLGSSISPIRITGTASIDCDPGIQMESISGGLVCQTAGGLYVAARSAPSTDYVRFQCTSTGNLLITPQLNSTSIFSRLSVGTSATPTVGQLHVQGNQSSQWGPHVSLAYNSGSYPVKMQLLPYAEGNLQILLDAHFDGSNVLSSSDNGCSRITRTSTGLSLEGSVTAAGTASVWTRGVHVNDNGSCDVGVSLTSAGPVIGNTYGSTKSTFSITGHGPTITLGSSYVSVTTTMSTAVTGCMLDSGGFDGARLFLRNASLYAYHFNVSQDTSRVDHDGTLVSLVAGRSLSLVWDSGIGTGRWCFPGDLVA